MKRPIVETTLKTPLAVSISALLSMTCIGYAQTSITTMPPITDPPPTPPSANSTPTANPYDRDDDIDGLANTYDEYPFDGATKRKEPPGIRHYGLLYLFNYPGAQSFGDLVPSGLPFGTEMAVSDDHQVSWRKRETIAQVNGTDLYKTHWRAWDNHLVIGQYTLTDVQIDHETTQSWGASDINPRGTLVGTWLERRFSTTKARGFYSGPDGTQFIQPLGGDLAKLWSSVMGASLYGVVRQWLDPLRFG